MKRLFLLLVTLVTCSTYAQFEITDTLGCQFPNPSSNVNFIVHHTQQECIDSCHAAYEIELLNSGVISVEVNGPSGYYHDTTGMNISIYRDSLLCPGIYSVTVMVDMGSIVTCSSSFTIDTLSMLEYNLSTTNETVTGACDGTATLDIAGGVQPYIITWYDSNQIPIPNENDLSIDSLCAGNYFYSVNSSWVGCCDTCPPCIGDSCGEVVFGGNGALIPFSIYGPIDLQVVWSMDEICPMACDGMVELMATGGSGNYTYTVMWSQPNGDFYGLCPGFYTAMVTDDIGNEAYTLFEIYPAIEPDVSVAMMNESCDQSCDGYLLLNDNAGQIYLWSIDGGQSYNNQNEYYNLCPGSYGVMGMNYNGCEIYIGTYTILEGSNPSISGVDYTSVSSPGANDACIYNIYVAGGSPPYSYTIDGNSFGLPQCGLSAGTHVICVVDVVGCYSCETIYISECDIQIYTSSSNESCSGACDGVGDAVSIGVSGNESYTWYDENGSLIGSSPSLTGLCPGIYTVDVYDIDGCLASDVITIEGAQVIEISNVEVEAIGCSYPCNMQATITASGGTGQLEYSIDGMTWSMSNIFNDLCPGVQIAYVRDENDCEQLFTFIIDDVFELAVETDVIIQSTSEQNCEGQLIATTSGGNPNYTFIWTNCETNDVVGNSELASNLCPGEYQITVYDNAGCAVVSECDTIFGTNGSIELMADYVSVFPNPATEVINISTTNAGEYEVRLNDLNGKVVFSTAFSGKNYQLELISNSVKPGVYTIEIQNEELRSRHRLIIK